MFEEGSRAPTAIEQDKKSTGSNAKTQFLLRLATIILAVALLVAYVAAIVTGKLLASHQISVASLIVIVIIVAIIGILVRPEALSNIQEFGIGDLSVKMRNRLQDLENTQESHTKELDQLRFTLLLMTTDFERAHLHNLHAESNLNYSRNPSVQVELRRLRAMDLIRMRKGFIADMPEHFNLGDWWN